MKNIILSIKDKYAKKIVSGEKIYEFRGWIWKEEVKYVYVYVSGKIKKIVARFEIEFIDVEKPKIIWEKYKNSSGISKKEFFEYVENFNYKQVFCIKIKNLKNLKYENYINLDIIQIKNAPQRFKYLKESENNILKRYFGE